MKLIRKTISVMLMLILIVSFTTIYAKAGIIGDNNESGGNGSTTTGDYSWAHTQQGYRFTLIDENGKAVSRKVDIMYTYAFNEFKHSPN